MLKVRWQHIAGIDLPVVLYGGDEWVPLAELAKTLALTSQRLRNACTSPVNYGRVRLATLMIKQSWVMVVARASLIHLAHRLRPGTNNRLLRFVHHADEISMGTTVDLLARRAGLAAERVADREARQERLQSDAQRQAKVIRELVRAFDGGDPLKELEWRWFAQTGLGVASLHAALSGRVRTVAQRIALLEMVRPAPRPFSRNGGVMPRGRKPQLTKDVILKIIAAQADGRTRADVAREFDTSAMVIKKIWDRTYCTKAMRDAIAALPKSGKAI